MTVSAEGTRAEALHFRADVDNSPWDADAALGKCKTASDFRSVCAAERNNDADPATAAHWALPHHSSPGGPPNKSGTSKALGRVDQTDGIDRDKARAHLEAHAAAWGGGQSSQLAPADVRSLRATQFGGQRRFRPEDGARLATFAAQFRHEPVIVGGKELRQLDGYASVVEQEYEMWDMFGPYGETVAAQAFDQTLGSAPDVAFLVNHKGVTMARSGGASPTLFLEADPRGLHSQALVNPKRTDVSDLLIAIDDQNVTEMSFAFRIEDWEWDEDYMHVRILQVDIDRGDVSAVNFGANPYTSIAARTQEFMTLLPHLPLGAGRAALDQLAARFGVPAATITRATTEAAAARRNGQDEVSALARGRSVTLVERLADLG